MKDVGIYFKAGLCKDMMDYNWFSYKEYINGAGIIENISELQKLEKAERNNGQGTCPHVHSCPSLVSNLE